MTSRSPPTVPLHEHEWVGLVESIAAGDQPAMRTLFERMHRVVFAMAVRICGDRELAEEVTLDVFVDIWHRSARYDPLDGSVSGWILMQTKSRAIDRLRFERRKKRVRRDPEDTQHVDVRWPGDDLDARERHTALEHALATLTTNEREAIDGAYFLELTYAETATHLQEPLGTIKTRMRSALAKLRLALAG